MAISNARKGDRVIFARDKQSPSPGPRAQEISALSKGDTYSYIVEKYWVVDEVRDDGMLLLRTRRGKVHEVSTDDPRLRHATFWEKWRYRKRFPQPNEQD